MVEPMPNAVAVGGTGIAVGGIAVGGIAVAVGGIAVAVGGITVAVGGSVGAEVAVNETEVAVSETEVAVNDTEEAVSSSDATLGSDATVAGTGVAVAASGSSAGRVKVAWAMAGSVGSGSGELEKTSRKTPPMMIETKISTSKPTIICFEMASCEGGVADRACQLNGGVTGLVGVLPPDPAVKGPVMGGGGGAVPPEAASSSASTDVGKSVSGWIAD